MCNGSVLAAGEPRIVDRSGRHQLPVGIESFEDVLESFTYVDKSLAVQSLVDRRGITLCRRPRRLGKSTFRRMLRRFFEPPMEGYVPNSRSLFDGLAISDDADGHHMEHCGAHPVIHLNLAGCGADSYEVTCDQIALLYVRKPLDLRTVFDDLEQSPEAVWAQLYQTGYVTTKDTGAPNDDELLRELRMPNLEVEKLYGKELLARATRTAGSERMLSDLHRALTTCNAPAVQKSLCKILLGSPSYHDLVDEGDYHVLLLALLYAVPGYRPATSNRESGGGLCDVLLEPRTTEAGRLPAHAIELKLGRGAKQDQVRLATCAREAARAQAELLEYGHDLTGTRLVRWGVAFSGKHVAVAIALNSTGAGA